VAITWYVAMTEATTVSLRQRLISDIGRDIGSGAIAVELLRPAPVLGVRVAGELGLVLAVACNVVASHAFAGVAFWWRDAGSAWFLYQKLLFIVGGMLIPLEALPGWLQGIAGVLPFKAMAYAPARLAAGHLEPGLLVLQVAWLALLWALASAVFRAGERRLQVVGG
jgi:ABC-2 type transport system permease protein